MHFISKVKDIISTSSSSCEDSTGITVGSMEANDLISNLSIVQRPSQDNAGIVDICVSVHPPNGGEIVRGPSDIAV